MQTDNLGIDLPEVSQQNKELVISTAIQRLDSAIAGEFAYNFTSDADFILVESVQQYINRVWTFTDTGSVLTQSRAIVFPDGRQGLHLVYNNTGQTLVLRYATGSATSIGPLSRFNVFFNGNDCIIA